MKQNIETYTGLFLMAGIALICGLIILFGEVPDLFKPTYTLTVTFPNAAGLLKGSDVYLSGALIGKVTTDPHPIPDTQQVEVKLKIDKSVGIRTNAGYVIGSEGLLGDKYVEVKPVVYAPSVPESGKAPFVLDGSTIAGTDEPGFEDVIIGPQPLLIRANDIAKQLDDMITRLNTQVFSGTSTDDLKETIAKLRHMVDNGDTIITNANDLMTNGNDLLNEAKNGKGVIGRLINDKQTGDNLAALMANLRVHGPIFYRDDSTDKSAPTRNTDEQESSRKKYQ
jgi:phospholipid/cholesterol/gamma-HCH transport system substrate-binding protein